VILQNARCNNKDNIIFQLKFWKYKICREKWTAHFFHWHQFVQAFWIALFSTRSVQTTNNFVLFSWIDWVVEFVRPNSWHVKFHFFYSIFDLSCNFNFSFDAQNLPLFVTVNLLSRYQSPVNRRSRNVVGNFTRNMNCRYYCHFWVLEFMEVPSSIKGVLFQGRGDGRIFKIVYFMENCTENRPWKRRYIRYRCSYILRIKRGRKTRAFKEINWYHWMYDVIAEVMHKPRSL